MNAKKILFATDFSPASSTVLAVAASLAHSAGAELIIAHVAEPPEAYRDEALRRGQLEQVRPSDPEVRVRRELRIGTPHEEIVRLADEEHADLLVIGSHGRKGLTEMLMGSVAEAVVRHANCPVLTVKPRSGSEA